LQGDDEGTILCDGQAAIPRAPYFTCLELAAQDNTASEAPAECAPFFECPVYGFDPSAVDERDLDGNGTPDSCEEAERIKAEWEQSVEYGEPYQDCTDPEDVGDPQCADISTLVGSGGGAVALLEDVIAIGAATDDVKAVIDVVQGTAPSAKENGRLQEFRQGQEEDFLMWGYADLAPIWDLAEAAIPTDVGVDGAADSGSGNEVIPPPPSDETLPPQTGFAIPSLDAEYRVENGVLLVTERIAVDFPAPVQGIDRDISTRITYDFVNDFLVTIEPLSVTRDGAPEPFEYSSGSGDDVRIRTGDPAC
jgi:hypothetical protein